METIMSLLYYLIIGIVGILGFICTIINSIAEENNVYEKIYLDKDTRTQKIKDQHPEQVRQIVESIRGGESYYLVELKSGRLLEYTYYEDKIFFLKEREQMK